VIKVISVLAIAMAAILSGCSQVDKVTVTAKDGINGTNGNDGSNGASCYTESIPGGIRLFCPDSTPQDIMDGKDGSKYEPGLLCNVHNLSNWNGVTNMISVLSASVPVGSFILPNLSVGNSLAANGFPGMPAELQSLVGLDGYALDCTGYITIDTSGMYTFSMLTDDGVRLMIDNNVIINSPQLQAPTERTAKSVELQKGRRSFNVIYYQGPMTQIALRLNYSGPLLLNQVVPASVLSH